MRNGHAPAALAQRTYALRTSHLAVQAPGGGAGMQAQLASRAAVVALLDKRHLCDGEALRLAAHLGEELGARLVAARRHLPGGARGGVRVGSGRGADGRRGRVASRT